MKAVPYFLFCIFSLLFSTIGQAADFYVQSVKAPIMSGPSFGSSKLAEAKKGDAVKELEMKGSWRKVSYKDKTGWISKLLVSSKPPIARVSVFERTSEKLETGARRRASAFTTAAAARGFAEDRTRVSDKYKANFRGVDRMEKIVISDDEALAFLQAGVGK